MGSCWYDDTVDEDEEDVLGTKGRLEGVPRVPVGWNVDVDIVDRVVDGITGWWNGAFGGDPDGWMPFTLFACCCDC